MKLNNLTFFAFFIFLLTSCSNPTSTSPHWVDQLIVQFKEEPVGNPPQSIWRYTYNNQIVYYVPPQCCDQFSTLYDEDGNVICAPDGGFSGTGDGKCPDFFEKRKDEKLIWQDERQQ